MTTIVLADDHPIVRQGLRALLETEPGWSVVGEAGDGHGALELIEHARPDVAVVDVMMPDLNGLEVVRRAAKRAPRTRLVVLSMHADESYALEALRGGASAYVLKATSTTSLVEAVRAALSGRRYLSPPLTELAIEALLHPARGPVQPFDRYELLTARERDVLFLAVQGGNNAAIADRLGIGARTVETHRANLMRKLGLRAHVDLVRYAIQRGLIDPD
jgi:two-component system response regulator NreC